MKRSTSFLPLLLAGLAGCQPQARRLLLLDEALTLAAELEATARPWRDAGYRVEYRRYYPHLTYADLDRYRIVLILGGRRPAPGSDALDLGDLALLTEWTLRGGVVVLGYPAAGEGTVDRGLMNHWLAWIGAGIVIADVPLRAAAQPVLNTGVRGTGFGAFPAGVNNALLVDDPASTLARTGPEASHAAVVAARRVADGLVVVLSRSALGAAGQVDSTDATGTRRFLLSLARWTRRPAEWSRIPGAAARLRLPLESGSRAAPPPGATVERLERQRPFPPAHPATAVPTWITRQGVRALEGDFPALAAGTPPSLRLAALDSLIRLLDAGGFNLLVTDAHAAPLIDSANSQRWERDALRAGWQQVAGRLQATSVRWLPLARPSVDSLPAEFCALDPAMWSRLATGIRVLARFAASRAELIPAIGLSFDATTEPWGTPALCDAAWQAGLAALTPDSSRPANRFARLLAVPRAARYDSLLEGGLLAAYDTTITRLVTQRAAALRADVRRIRRGLLLALVMERSPTDWFTRSLVQGLSTPEWPALVFSPDPGGQALLNTGDTATVLHALRLDPSALLQGRVTALARTVFQEHDGFWLGPAEALLAGSSDSLARLARRLVKER